MAFGLGPLLTAGGVEALSRHGSEELRARYLEKLVSGEWTATMNLTVERGLPLVAVPGGIVRRGVAHAGGTHGPRDSDIPFGCMVIVENIIVSLVTGS